MRRVLTAALTLLVFASLALAQERPTAAGAAQPDTATQLRQLSQSVRSEGFRADEIQKEVDDLMWHIRLQDIAEVDKISITGKPIRMANPTGQGAGNPFIIYGYSFVPKKHTGNQKAPMIVLVHGG